MRPKNNSNYGNINYGLIDSNGSAMIGQDIPMPQTAAKLPYPPTSGYFFETIRDEALDTLDKIIQFTKKGHLKMTIKTNVFTNGGDINFQVYKVSTNSIVARRRCSTDGYTEINFDLEVDRNDRIYIYVQATIGDALLQYIPADGSFIEQSAYIINMELIEPFDEIGSLKWSVDPNLESYGNCIRLDLVRPLLISDYPLLYAKLAGTIYIDNDDGINFTLINFTQHPYLRAGSALNILTQNLPDPIVTSAFTGYNTVSDGTDTGHAFFGGNNHYALPEFEAFTGIFRPGSSDTQYAEWGGNWGLGSQLPITNIILRVSEHNEHILSGRIDNITTSPSYSTDQNIRPNTAQMFLYMICDNQL